MAVVRITTKGAKRHHLAVWATLHNESVKLAGLAPLCQRNPDVREWTVYGQTDRQKPLCKYCYDAARDFRFAAPLSALL